MSYASGVEPWSAETVFRGQDARRRGARGRIHDHDAHRRRRGPGGDGAGGGVGAGWRRLAPDWHVFDAIGTKTVRLGAGGVSPTKIMTTAWAVGLAETLRSQLSRA